MSAVMLPAAPASAGDLSCAGFSLYQGTVTEGVGFAGNFFKML